MKLDVLIAQLQALAVLPEIDPSQIEVVVPTKYEDQYTEFCGAGLVAVSPTEREGGLSWGPGGGGFPEALWAIDGEVTEEADAETWRRAPKMIRLCHHPNSHPNGPHWYVMPDGSAPADDVPEYRGVPLDVPVIWKYPAGRQKHHCERCGERKTNVLLNRVWTCEACLKETNK